MKQTKHFGDLIVKRTKKRGGFEIYLKEGIDDKPQRICFFNEKGMEELAKWIKKIKPKEATK